MDDTLIEELLESAFNTEVACDICKHKEEPMESSASWYFTVTCPRTAQRHTCPICSSCRVLILAIPLDAVAYCPIALEMHTKHELNFEYVKR